MKKALIAMSGGVDSSLAAKLMLDRGYDCIGCTMKLYGGEASAVGQSRACRALKDAFDAESVARSLGMPYYVFDFTDDFRDRVINRFVVCYEAGKTPNPCIDCNRYMKFGKLYERAEILGCDCVATGHYARIEKRDGKFLLKKASDEAKDQSYVLYSLTQEQLARTVFPLGELKKTDVRRMAEECGFQNSAKPDSQDICFVPDGDYAGFLERCTGKKYPAGNFISTDGSVLGRHRGTVRYTVGQRKGLGLSFPEPMYVCKINTADNTVTLGAERELYGVRASVGDFNWICGKAPGAPIRCNVRLRYRHAEQPATVIPTSDSTADVVFDAPQRAITPGQAAVLYDGDTVLGGGSIL